MNKKRLPSFSNCFCCGQDNKSGLNTAFYLHGDEVTGYFTPKTDYCGYPGVMHGGITATLLDEAMTWAASISGNRFYYAGEIKVRYCAPVIDGEEIQITAKTVDKLRKWLIVEGTVFSKNKKILAKSEGKYYPLQDDDDIKVKNMLTMFKDGFYFQ